MAGGGPPISILWTRLFARAIELQTKFRDSFYNLRRGPLLKELILVEITHTELVFSEYCENFHEVSLTALAVISQQTPGH